MSSGLIRRQQSHFVQIDGKSYDIIEHIVGTICPFAIEQEPNVAAQISQIRQIPLLQPTDQKVVDAFVSLFPFSIEPKPAARGQTFRMPCLKILVQIFKTHLFVTFLFLG